MKILSIITLITFVIAPELMFAQEQEVTYNLSVSNSLIKWKTKDAEIDYSGSVKLKNGFFTLKGDELTAAVVFIDMKSITCESCGGEIQGQDLLKFIKSTDFLNVLNMDYAVFKMSQASKIADSKKGNYNLKGALSIAAYSNEISFPVEIVSEKKKMVIDGSFSINRDLWNLKTPVQEDGTAYTMESKVILSFTLETE